MPLISVFIVVEVSLYRMGLTTALAQTPGMQVVGSFASIREAASAISDNPADIVLLDPGADPDFTLVSLIAEVAPRSRIVALGVREVEPDVLHCAENGLAAYVPRDASISDLITVIESTARGELHCSPRIAASLFRRVGLLTEAKPTDAALTPREQEIAALIGEGLSNKQIAQRLQIGVSTVKNHVHNLLKKLNTSRRTVAAARIRSARSGTRPSV